MDSFTIYHNPRCSKSRAALALLEENDIRPEIIYYLENPLEPEVLKQLLNKLNIGIRELLRKSETEYKELGLGDASLADEILFDILSKHPKLMQRPIVVRGEDAIIARPPENVLNLIGD
jgi:arsenate reductase (glutaredoxin)